MYLFTFYTIYTTRAKISSDQHLGLTGHSLYASQARIRLPYGALIKTIAPFFKRLIFQNVVTILITVVNVSDNNTNSKDNSSIISHGTYVWYTIWDNPIGNINMLITQASQKYDPSLARPKILQHDSDLKLNQTT